MKPKGIVSANGSWRAAVIYLVICASYILLSDHLLATLSENISVEYVSKVQSIKGIFFILITALVIYYITFKERKRLILNHQTYLQLFSHHPLPMWIILKESKKIVAVNPKAIEIYGYTEEEFLRMNVVELHPPDERKEILNHLSNSDAPIFQLNSIRHRRKDGSYIYVNISSHFFEYNGKEARLASATIITELIDTQKKVLERENFLKSLVDSQSTYLIRFDMQGNFTYVNRSFQEKFNHITDNFIGKSFTVSVIPEDVETVLSAFQEATSDPESIPTVHIRKPAADGIGLCLTEWEFSGLFDNQNQPIGLQAVGRDITAEKETAIALKKTTDELEFVLEYMGDGFLMITRNATIIRANESALKMLALEDQSRAIGQNLVALIPQLNRSAVKMLFHKCIESNEQVTGEVYSERISKWFRVNFTPTKLGIIVLFNDITTIKEAELRIIQSEYNLNALINNTSDYIWSIDADLKYITLNDAFKKALFRSNKIHYEPGSKSSIFQRDSDYTTRWRTYYSRGLLGESFTIREKNIGSNNESHEISFNPIRDNHGRVVGVGCFAKDITNRIHQEEIINDSLERFNLLSMNVREAIWEWNVDKKDISWNIGLLSIFGYALETTTLDWIYEKVHPDDLEHLTNEIKQTELHKLENIELTFRFRIANKSYHQVLVRGTLLRNKNGDLVRALGSLQDIQTLVSQSEEIEMLSMIAQVATNGIIIVDNLHNFVWFNKAFSELVGQSLSDLVGKNIREVLDPELFTDEMYDEFLDILDNNGNVSQEVVLINNRKKRIHSHVEISPYKNSKNQLSFVSVFTDLTERMKTEKTIKNQNKQLKEIAWITAHELRKPVSTILGLIDLLNKEKMMDEKNLELIQYLNESTEELDQKVQEIVRKTYELDGNSSKN